MHPAELDLWFMGRALELAARGQGFVEPNPMVGCVIVSADGVIGEGWHRRFGGDHAEIEALRIAGPRAAGATAYVTLEPCCHVGKTRPCTRALIAAGIRRVAAAQRDPFAAVAGRGLAELAAAGIEVEVGLMESEARRLNAPYLHRIATGRPWVIAKWAMTLDGRIATRAGQSKWITGPEARQIGHALRGRVDGVMIGSGTAAADDPLLTARPPGPRIATRIIVDSRASLASTSRLAQSARAVRPALDDGVPLLACPAVEAARRGSTAGQASSGTRTSPVGPLEGPVLVAVGADAPAADRARLTAAGCEVFLAPGATHAERLTALLDELGRRQMTNLLVEGGAKLLGNLWDLQAIDEVHVFIAPKLIGGATAPGPLGGEGLADLAAALPLADVQTHHAGDDFYISGRIKRGQADGSV